MSDKGTKKVKQRVKLDFSIPGDDQGKVLERLTAILKVLDDIKVSSLEMTRIEYMVYDE